MSGRPAQARQFTRPKGFLVGFLVLVCALPAPAAPFKVTGAKTPKGRTPPRREVPKLGIPTIPVIDSKTTIGWDGKTGTGGGTDGTDGSTTSSSTTGTGSSSAGSSSTSGGGGGGGAAAGITALGGGGASAGSGAGASGSAGGGAAGALAGSGSGGVSDSAKAGIDESRKHTDPVSTVDGDGGDKKGPGPGAPEQQSISQFPFIWPMCIFAARGISIANGVVNQLIKMTAKCKVQLMVFPMYVKSTSGDGKAVAAAASAKCNADVGLKRFGVNRATALVITDDEKQPAQFCNVSGSVNPKDKRGCAQSTYDVGYGVTTRLANTEGLPSKAHNKIAAAIVHKSATIQDFAYWTQGWAQVGRPPGPGGNRVGDWSMGYSDARSDKSGWDEDFCADMRKNSFKNPGIKYDPKHDRWMMEPDDKGKLVDLFDKKPLWREPNGPPAPGKDLGNPSAAGGDELASSGAGQGGGGSPSDGSAGTARLNAGGSSAGGGEGVLTPTSGGGGHKIAGRKPGGRGDSVRTVSDVYGGGGGGGGGTSDLPSIASSDPGVVTVDRKPGSGGSGNGLGGGERVGFDESMTANGPTSTVGGGGGLGGSGGGTGSGGLGGSSLSGGSTLLTGGGLSGSLGGGGFGGAGGAGGSSGGSGTGLSSMDKSFFSRLNFVPIEGIRKRVPLLKDQNGVLSSRERGNWDGSAVKAPSATTDGRAPAGSAPARGPASVRGDDRGAKEKPADADTSVVVSRRGKAE